jgi:hypothetical protein
MIGETFCLEVETGGSYLNEKRLRSPHADQLFDGTRPKARE